MPLLEGGAHNKSSSWATMVFLAGCSSLMEAEQQTDEIWTICEYLEGNQMIVLLAVQVSAVLKDKLWSSRTEIKLILCFYVIGPVKC